MLCYFCSSIFFILRILQREIEMLYYLDPRSSVEDGRYPNDGVCKRRALSADAGHDA